MGDHHHPSYLMETGKWLTTRWSWKGYCIIAIERTTGAGPKSYVQICQSEAKSRVGCGRLCVSQNMPYRSRSLAKKRCERFSLRFFRPYKVMELVGALAYRLKLLAMASIHNVFHVSRLKKAVGEGTVIQAKPSHLSYDFEWTTELEEILGVRWNAEEKCQ